MFKTLCLLFLPFSVLLSAESVCVDLNHPSYKNGILYTNQGGVIKGPHLRIQAKSIQYIHRKENGQDIHQVEAEGDLMIQYKGNIYTGIELIYDFISQSGVIYGGKTATSLWYISGEKIDLQKGGTICVENASMTTSENKKSSWDIHAQSVQIFNQNLLKANQLRLRFFGVPCFWIPSFKINLDVFNSPILKKTLSWDSGQGLKAELRAALYSWNEFALFGRVGYRVGKGWQGAIETEYEPQNSKTRCLTQSYVGTDTLVNATNLQFRYRFIGDYSWQSETNQTQATIKWDKYSDVRMPADFKTSDFELNTAKQTLAWIHHTTDLTLSSLKVRPRINPFESIKQDLPTFYTALLPIRIGPTEIYSFSHFKAAYLDFLYSTQLASNGPLKPPENFHAGRLEVFEMLYRPFRIGPLILTPNIGGSGILYTNSPSSDPQCVGTFMYGLKLSAKGYRGFDGYQHYLEPYLHFKAETRPTFSPEEHYIFSIQDGYNKIQQIKAGFKTLLFHGHIDPFFTGDVYADAFFSDPVIPQVIPRGYLSLNWHIPTLDLLFYNGWNFRHHLLDFSILRLRWTVNEAVAFSIEGRYRSKYDWRKADHDDFILDVSRSEKDLLASPLSDRRISLLTNFFFRLSPFWECSIQSHHGFYRTTENPYNEVKLTLSTWIHSRLKLKMSLGHTEKESFFYTLNLDLLKNPHSKKN